jgi:hypothetical protein
MAKFNLDSWRPKPRKDAFSGKKQNDTTCGRDISRRVERQQRQETNSSLSCSAALL